MDTTTSTSCGERDELKSTYVSCIKVDGLPILPPLMTDERRQQMRFFKELAIQKEKALQGKRNLGSNTNTASTLKSKSVTSSQKANIFSSSDSPLPLERRATKVERFARCGRSPSTSPEPGVPATSTPRTKTKLSKISSGIKSNIPSIQRVTRKSATFSCVPSEATVDVIDFQSIPADILREQKVLEIKKSESGNTDHSERGESASPRSLDEDEEIKGESGESGHNYDGSDDNFESATSSTGTFIIRKSAENVLAGNLPQEHSAFLGKNTSEEENQLSTSEGESESKRRTVLRKPSIKEEAMFKRKRPAKYFDMDDHVDDIGHRKEPERDTLSTIPNRVLQEQPDSIRDSGPGTPKLFSSVPKTDFTVLAKSVTKEFSDKFCQLVTSSPSAAASSSSTAKNRRVSSSGSYNVTLSKDIPSSAEENPRSESEMSDCSDKENKNTVAVHNNEEPKYARKLSYTLATPSAVLLEAASTRKNFVQKLEIESSPSDTGPIQVLSSNPSPLKFDNEASVDMDTLNMAKANNTRLFQDGRVSSDLANLSLRCGKKEHLKRFLGEQNDHSQVKVAMSSSDLPDPHDVQLLLRRMYEEQDHRMQELAKQHRLQELKLKREFESELEKLRLKEKLKLHCIKNANKDSKTSPESLLESQSSSLVQSTKEPSSRSQKLTQFFEDTLAKTDEPNSEQIITSGMSGVSISEQTQSSVYQFTGGSGGFSAVANAPLDLAVVGLSKLQTRMQLMSPKLFRVPTDAKSPLLKGLLFPDPLDKPRPPIRIPTKALDAHMKTKFDKISAAVKGYLTRRLLITERVQIILQTIKDTGDLLLKLYEEAPSSGSTSAAVRPQDSELQQRLIQQLTGACQSFHDVFFKLSTKERMAIIATDREKLKTKAMRALASPARPNISNATLKSIERRMSHRLSPKRNNRKSRVSKVYDPITVGSQSVKPKSVKNFNISPKRRRISYWDDGKVLSRSTNSLVGQDLNGNNCKRPTNARSQQIPSVTSSKLKTQLPLSGNIGETFIVPSVSRRSISSGNWKSSTRDSSSRMISRTPQAMHPASGSSSNIANYKGSSSRQPWNAGSH